MYRMELLRRAVGVGTCREMEASNEETYFT
jgi:hypothetical protein